MTILENPFTPTFGEAPTHLAGRESIIKDIKRALEAGQRRPELTTIFSGARGTGKTTLLTLIAQQAAEFGWVTVSVTAMPGMLEDIEVHARKQSAHLIDSSTKTHIRSIGIPQAIDIAFEHSDNQPNNWRSRMEDLLNELESKDSGLLIAVDELDVSLPEMVELAAVYQHFVRDGRKAALFMAGLPSSVSSLVSNRTVSFLRRAEMVHLGRIDDHEIEVALRRTIEDAGRHASASALHHAAQSINGFPFMMQLIGFRAWEQHPDAECITAEDFENAIQLARADMRTRIFEATFRELSDADIKFLQAMLEDETESHTADLVKRLSWSSSQVAQYRRRLLEAGIIGERRRGVIGFDMPYFREFLLDLF